MMYFKLANQFISKTNRKDLKDAKIKNAKIFEKDLNDHEKAFQDLN